MGTYVYNVFYLGLLPSKDRVMDRQITVSPIAAKDNFGNVCYASAYSGSILKAEEALKSLENCENMTNCSHCKNSKGCVDVNYAINSYYCKNSSNILRCTRVKNSKQLQDCKDVNKLNNQSGVKGRVSFIYRAELFINKILRRIHAPEVVL